MDSPVLSLEGFFAMEAELPERIRAEIRARQQLDEALKEERDYWARLSSTVFCDTDGSDVDLSKVQDEFKEYAVYWRRYRGGLNVITDFAAHIALRDERLQRNIDRKARAEAKLRGMSAAAGGAVAPVTRAAAPAETFDDGDVKPMSVDPNCALEFLEAIDAKLRGISDEICRDVPSLDQLARDTFTEGFTHMMATFTESGAFRRKYGASGSDRKLAASLKVGGDVPSYFANVSDGSIFRRKVLSMAGLRNLITYGPIIYTQLRDLLFTGELEAHPNDAGLKLMRRVTGNVVDLDTTVLRCTDAATLNAINASNKHKKLATHANSNAFAASSQAQEIATHCAIPLLADFAKACGLTPQQCQARRIDPAQIGKPIPVAGNNTDRGKHPVWQYVNAGQNSFHANVPTMSDVNGALLKSPFHCVRAWFRIHALYAGTPDLQTRIEDFFEHCVVDSCFNGKWKAIEEYNARMAHEGTIVDVLQRAQMKNQAIFTAEFFDADDDDQTKEIAEMVTLTRGLVGRDKTGVTRAITGDDVAAWVRDPSVTI